MLHTSAALYIGVDEINCAGFDPIFTQRGSERRLFTVSVRLSEETHSVSTTITVQVFRQALKSEDSSGGN